MVVLGLTKGTSYLRTFLSYTHIERLFCPNISAFH
nr:MAG TPA: hypothetical protein [Caudoviricetes sp.]